MIRWQIVYNAVLSVYRIMPQIVFPLNIKQIIELYNNCRCQSYERFAEINQLSLQEVINFCESKSGCTQYDIANRRYLILCNEHENPRRVRWTYAHELGHILCGHFLTVKKSKGFDKSIDSSYNQNFEQEADAFAASLLCPFSLFDVLEIHKESDIYAIFGLSYDASKNRWKDFNRYGLKNEDKGITQELQSLFHQKRPRDEIIFDVPHNAISVPNYHNFNGYNDISLFSSS